LDRKLAIKEELIAIKAWFVCNTLSIHTNNGILL